MFTMSKLSKPAFLMVAVLVFSAACLAQTSKGIIAGTVHDSTGAVMAGATVTVTNVSTSDSRNTTTSEIGTYRIEAVEPGLYTIKVASPNFKTTTIDKVEIKGSVITTVNANLQV